MKRISIYFNAVALGLALALTLASTVRAQNANVSNVGVFGTETYTTNISVVPLDSSSGLGIALPGTSTWADNGDSRWMSPAPQVRDYSMHPDHAAVALDMQARLAKVNEEFKRKDIIMQVPGLTIRKDPYDTLDGEAPRFVVLGADLVRQGMRLKVWTNLRTVVVGNTGYGSSGAGVTFIDVPDSAGAAYLPWQEENLTKRK